MPQSEEKKENTLIRLRKNFDRFDSFFRYGEPISHSQIAQRQVSAIVRKKMNVGFSGWGAICKEARLHSNFTLQEVAFELNVSHAAILDQEKIEEKYTIDPFYLEAFSILYDVQPMILLGFRKERAFDPMRAIGNEFDQWQNIIFNSLYMERSPLKTEFLHALAVIGAMKYNVLMILAEIFKTIPSLKHIPEIQLSDDNYKLLRDKYDWMDDYTKLLPMGADPESQQYKDRRVYLYARTVIDDLLYKRSPVLRLMAQLSVCDEDIMKLVIAIVSHGGLITGKRSLVNYCITTPVCRGY